MDHLERFFFIQPRLVSSRLRERRRREGRSRSERMRGTAEPETGFEKVYIEPSVQSWLMQKRFLTCLSSTNGLYIFDIFTSARNESRPWLHIWITEECRKKNHLPFSVLSLPPEICRLDLKNILASNFFLLKNRITETVIYFGRNEIRFKFVLFKWGISRKNEFLKVITVKIKKNFVEVY